MIVLRDLTELVKWETDILISLTLRIELLTSQSFFGIPLMVIYQPAAWHCVARVIRKFFTSSLIRHHSPKETCWVGIAALSLSEEKVPGSAQQRHFTTFLKDVQNV